MLVFYKDNFERFTPVITHLELDNFKRIFVRRSSSNYYIVTTNDGLNLGYFIKCGAAMGAVNILFDAISTNCEIVRITNRDKEGEEDDDE